MNTDEAKLSKPGSTCRVLLAEDMEVVRELYAQLLLRAGCSVDMAGDGREAWGLLQTRSYDILITDHMMPNLSGLDLIRRVRDENRQLPCLLVSGDLPVGEADLAQLVTPGGLLPKPFSRTEFLDAVHSALHRITPLVAVP